MLHIESIEVNQTIKNSKDQYYDQILEIYKNKKLEYGDLFEEYSSILRTLQSNTFYVLKRPEMYNENVKKELIELSENLFSHMGFSKELVFKAKDLLERNIWHEIESIKPNISRIHIIEENDEIIKIALELVRFFVKEADKRTKNFKTKKEFDNLFRKINSSNNINDKKVAKTIIAILIKTIIAILILMLFLSLFSCYKYDIKNKKQKISKLFF